MSAGDINKLMHLWGLSLTSHGDTPPFADHRDLYATIDETPIGDVRWQSFSMKYNSDVDSESDHAQWMNASYTVWFRDPRTVIHNMLGNPDLKNETDYVPYREWIVGEGDDSKRQWCNVMSGDWAWDQAVSLMLSIVDFFFIDTAQSRTRLLKIQIRMVQCLFQLYSEVTKLRYQHKRGKMTTIHYMSQLVTFTTMSAVHTVML